jgi:hypothetical protein
LTGAVGRVAGSKGACRLATLAAIGGKPERRTNRRIDCALDETKYPDLRGQWTAIGGSVKYVPDKPRGFGQDAPLTPGYQAIFEANLTWCLSPGMPRVTNGYGEIAFVITPETFHILVFHVLDSRRILPTGATLRPMWIHLSSRFPSAVGSTRRATAATTAGCGDALYLRQDQDVISNEVTVFDHALTRPWIVTKHYRRSPDPQPWWVEDNCMGNNYHYPHPGRAVRSQRRRDAHADQERPAAS